MIITELFRLFGRIMVDNRDANDSISRTESKFGDIIGTIGKVGVAAAAAAAAIIAAIGVKAVSAADEFNKAMNGLAASTGSSGDELAEFRDIAKSIYNNNFGESFDDIAKAMATVKQVTNETGAELEKTTTNALMMRDTFEFDVSASINTVNSLVQQFGISSDEAFALITQGAQMGANKNDDLLDTLNEYAPQFKALGFSAEEFNDVLIQGAADGAFSIDKMGDAIKEFTIRSKDLSEGSLGAFESLGLNGQKMSEAFAAGGQSAQEAFQTVMTKLEEVKDPLELNTIGVQLFGTQFEDLESTAITSLAHIVSNTDLSRDTLEQINAIKYDTFGEALTGIGRNLETGILIPIGEKVLPKLAELSTWVIAHMPEIQSNIQIAVDVATDVFNKLAGAVQWVIDNGDILIPVIAGITAAVTAQFIINTLIALYNTWKAATVAQTTVQWLLNAALNANPLGIIALAIGAVIAVGVLLYKNWDTIREKAALLWEWVKENWDKVIAFTGPIGLLIAAGVNLFKNWDKIKETAKSLGVAVKEVWNGIVSGIKGSINFVIETINGFINRVNSIEINVPSVDILGKKIGGFSVGLPKVPTIPMLAEGGDITKAGRVLVGERGPEFLDLPAGASVKPLDKVGGVTFERGAFEGAVIMDDYGVDRLMDRIEQRMRLLGVST